MSTETIDPKSGVNEAKREAGLAASGLLGHGAKFKITITMDAELITDLKRGVSKDEIIQMFYADCAYGLKSIVVGRLDDENTPHNDHDTEVTWDNTEIVVA